MFEGPLIEALLTSRGSHPDRTHFFVAGPLRAHRSAATRPSGHRKRTSALRSSHLRAAPMAFEMDRIAREWLGGSRLAIAPSEVVAGFNKAEELLGAEWIQAYKGGAGQDLAGAGVALPIAVAGLQLRSVQGAPGLNEVLSRLKARDRAARSELAAASYCVEGQADVRLEFGAHVRVGARNRRPDFRVAVPGDAWTHVEVTAPDRSEANRRAERMISAIADKLFVQQNGSTIEVLLLREISGDDEDRLAHEVTRMAAFEQRRLEELGDLAVVEVNAGTPGQIEAGRDFGRELGPLLAIARGLVTRNLAQKHIIVKTPVTDRRAADFLTSEAKQLPTGEPGLVVLDMAAAPDSFDNWETILRGRLQPSMHTRVSAVLLIRSSVQAGAEHVHWIVSNRLIENPNGALPLPRWLAGQLESSQRSAYSSLPAAR